MPAPSSEKSVRSSSIRPEGYIEEMPDVAAGDRSDEEDPGNRLKRIAVPTDQCRQTDGAPDRPADDEHAVDQSIEALPCRGFRHALVIRGWRRVWSRRALADHRRDGSVDRRDEIEVESTAQTEAERA